MLDDLDALLRMVVVFTFLTAATSKSRNIPAFQWTLRRMNVPTMLIQPIAVIVVVSELSVALTVPVGGRAEALGLMLALGLVLGFTAVVVWVLARQIQVTCACLGGIAPMTWPHLFRNGVLLAVIASSIPLSGARGYHPLVVWDAVWLIPPALASTLAVRVLPDAMAQRITGVI